MKKFLLFTLFCAVSVIALSQASSPTNACGVRDVLLQNIERVDVNSSDGLCNVRFDVSFTMDANSGNKRIYIASYIESTTAATNPHPYPNHFQCSNGITRENKPPITAAQLGDPILFLAINNTGGSGNQNLPPQFENTYLPNPAVGDPLLTGVTAGTTIDTILLANGDIRFVIENLEITLPYECGTATSVFITDVFATQAASANTLHCVNCGIRTGGGQISIGGNTNCGEVNATLTNNTAAMQMVNYSLYVDLNTNGVFTPGVDSLLVSGSVQINGGSTYAIPTYTLPSYLIGYSVFVLVNSGGTSIAQLLPTIDCVPLPVSFRSFNATRRSQNVQLRWETELEINNRGFYVQRNLGRTWTDVAFVVSRADGGNSSGVLAYELTDLNPTKGVTQYRILQVDLDGKTKISQVRAVRGEMQPSKTLLYPNPSRDGSVSIVFEDVNTSRDVMVSDISGRIVKQWKGVTDNNMRITNLMPGTYLLRIFDVQNGTQVNEKLIISKQ